MTVNTKADLESLPCPAAYVMKKTVSEASATTTTIAHVIKVDDALYLMMCTAAPMGATHRSESFQIMDKRSPVAMLEKFAGFDFIQADLTYTENPTKPEVVRDEH